MSGEERQQLVNLIRLYVGRATDEVAENEWRRIEAAGPGDDHLSPGWAARVPARPLLRDQRGPTFLIEYDNTQDDATHIHSVWRDFTNDWERGPAGRPLCCEHRRRHLSRRARLPKLLSQLTDLALTIASQARSPSAG